jgi:hypothetical protein
MAQKFDGLTDLILEHEWIAMKIHRPVFERSRHLVGQFFHGVARDDCIPAISPNDFHSTLHPSNQSNILMECPQDSNHLSVGLAGG